MRDRQTMALPSPQGNEKWTRRQWLQSALAAGGLAMSGHASGVASEEAKDDSGPPADPKSGYIDAHVHVWTPDTKTYPLANGYTKEEMQPPSFTPTELFSHCRPQGVTRITLIQMSFYGFDNSYMLDMIEKHKGVFSGVAVINEHANRPEDEMRRLAKRGVRGFRIFHGKHTADEWLGSPGMQKMWKCGAEDRLWMCHLTDPEYLPAIDRMCQKYPDTPVVIDHFARIGMTGTIDQKQLDNLCKLARHKTVYVKVSAFYALGKKRAPYVDLAPMIRRLYDAYGPERLMWASDCPFQVQQGHTYKDSIALIRDRIDFLSASDKEWLLKKTAEHVFFS